MQTDRELLEAAARACGEWPSPEPFEHVMNRWNPLTDDGDNFRLMVQLDIHIVFFSKVVLAGVRGGMIPSVEEPIGESKIAATRRAVVRAAAAMSEQSAPA